MFGFGGLGLGFGDDGLGLGFGLGVGFPVFQKTITTNSTVDVKPLIRDRLSEYGYHYSNYEVMELAIGISPDIKRIIQKDEYLRNLISVL